MTSYLMDCIKNFSSGFLAWKCYSAFVLTHFALINARILCKATCVDEVEVCEKRWNVVSEFNLVIRDVY